MCVIVGFTQKTRGREEVLACLDRAYTRGPDMARVAETASGWLGFRRLSIMGLDERGMQPFALGPDQVVCNGGALRLAEAARRAGAEGLHLPQRQRLRAPAAHVPGVRAGHVCPAGRGVRP